MSESTRVPERVREIVAEALARSPSDVRLDSILMADLGAESLDFLDIVFKLEHEFHIQITRG
ncbi:MAG: acyl carrier protein, partial [Deltaproteobacteria bacterium]